MGGVQQIRQEMAEKFDDHIDKRAPDELGSSMRN